MGIRFRCHHCESQLHVKDFQAGKRGRCPECGGRFRVPLEDAPYSLEPHSEVPQAAVSGPPATSQSTAEVTAAEVTAAADHRSHAKPTQPGSPSSQSTAAAAQQKSPAATPETTAAPAESMATAPATAPATTPATTPAATTSPLASPQREAHAEAAAPSAAAPPLAPPPPPPPAIPRALQGSLDVKWYVRPPSGGQYGPAPSTTMWQWLSENRVGRDALVWAEGWPEWLIAENAFDDFFQIPTPPTAGDIPPPHASLPHEHLGAPVAPSPTVATGASPAEPLLADRNRAERKQKKRRNYTILIVGLAVIMLVLIGTLIFVLGSQAS